MTEYSNGDRVVVKTYGEPARDAVVHDKTRGDATVVRYPDGSTELIANKAIRKES